MDTLITATLIDGNYQLAIQDATQNTMQIDLPVEQGGKGQGMRPMQTMLAALAGCSNVDVVSILQKQKQTLTDLQIRIAGQREQGKDLAVWETIHMVFEAKGDVDAAKLYRAVALSIEKYCSVAETLRRAGATISFEAIVNGIVYQP